MSVFIKKGNFLLGIRGKMSLLFKIFRNSQRLGSQKNQTIKYDVNMVNGHLEFKYSLHYKFSDDKIIVYVDLKSVFMSSNTILIQKLINSYFRSTLKLFLITVSEDESRHLL